MLLPRHWRRPAERAVPVVLAVTVFAFAAGSSSVPAVKSAGLDFRWIALVVLTACAVVAAGRLPRVTAVAAGAGVLVGLAAVSSAWSVDPSASMSRAVAFGLLLATALLLATVAGERDRFAQRVLAGLLVGAAGVVTAGAVVMVVSYGTAVVPASLETPVRYRGFGENPNTVSLLLALASPVALHFALRCRKPGERVGLALLLSAFAANLVASGSKGALLAAAAGCAVTGAAHVRRHVARAATCGAAVAFAAVGLAVQGLPQPHEASKSISLPSPGAAVASTPRYEDAEAIYPLSADLGRPLPGNGEPAVRRSLFAASGRTTAWRGAIEQAAQRPLLGYGFGTEARVFEDRYYRFVGGLPENSYVGLFLQLGVAGVAALLGLVALLVVSGRRMLGPGGGVAPVALGVLVAGLALGVVQSYLYSVGNIGAATFWIASFLAAFPADGVEP